MDERSDKARMSGGKRKVMVAGRAFRAFPHEGNGSNTMQVPHNGILCLYTMKIRAKCKASTYVFTHLLVPIWSLVSWRGQVQQHSR